MTEKKYVLVCMNVDCRTRGAGKVMDRLQSCLQGDGCGDVELRSYMCFGGWKSRTGILNKPAAFWFPGSDLPSLCLRKPMRPVLSGSVLLRASSLSAKASVGAFWSPWLGKDAVPDRPSDAGSSSAEHKGALIKREIDL